MTARADQPDPLAGFSLGATMNGHIELDHYPRNDQTWCYWSLGIDNGTTIPQLIELARKHLAEKHHAEVTA